jgi:hypothetical protein
MFYKTVTIFITKFRNNVNFFISLSVSAEKSVKNDEAEEKNLFSKKADFFWASF